MKKVCKECGREFESGTGRNAHKARYCSDECRRTARARTNRDWQVLHRGKTIQRVCEECGAPIPEGVNRNTKYCSRACYNKAYMRRWRKAHHVKSVMKTCPICGKEFETTENGQQKYCSKLCSRRAYAGSDLRTATCAVCGKTFETWRRNAKTCSPECSKKYINSQHHSNGKKTEKTCIFCGKKFFAYMAGAKTCSPSCAALLRHWGTPENRARILEEKRAEAIRKAAEKMARRQKKRTGGLTDEQIRAVESAQDGDQSKLYSLSRNWTPKQREYAKARYRERYGVWTTSNAWSWY